MTTWWCERCDRHYEPRYPWLEPREPDEVHLCGRCWHAVRAEKDEARRRAREGSKT